MYCIKCGNQLKNRDKFCTRCGAKIHNLQDITSEEYLAFKRNELPALQIENVWEIEDIGCVCVEGILQKACLHMGDKMYLIGENGNIKCRSVVVIGTAVPGDDQIFDIAMPETYICVFLKNVEVKDICIGDVIIGEVIDKGVD